ncbi:MAG: hypothetical protein KAH84_07685 [Thiomargarita sp.]|nr:hypothetical protein [Thiomargarita sp.]
MMQLDKFDTGKIKKIVGKTVVEHPLKRAFKLHLMLEELRGKRFQSNKNVKKEVKSKEFH